MAAWSCLASRDRACWLVLLLALALAAPLRAAGLAPVEYVVLISIDGLRPDAIDAAPAPNIQSLRRAGARFESARSVLPSNTLPNHAAMLTGLNTPSHEVYTNKRLPGYIPHPTIFSLLKQHGGRSAALFAKAKLSHFTAPAHVDYIYGPGYAGVGYHDTTAERLAELFAGFWPVMPYAFTFIHLREPDRAGHKHEWMSPQYLAAVRRADLAVGRIVAAIRKSGRWPRTALIITADHGGVGVQHWDDDPRNRAIPWILVAPKLTHCAPRSTPLEIYDTTAVVLRLLGIAVPPELDGADPYRCTQQGG